jgi:hypothetical protein
LSGIPPSGPDAQHSRRRTSPNKYRRYGTKPTKLLWAAALVAGLITALPAASAHAVTQTTVKTAQSASNTQAVKEIPVECPVGEFVYGAGGTITGGGTGNVALQAVVPEGNPAFRVRVTAAALGAVTGAWSVEAWAICGPFTTNLQVVSTPAGTSTARTKERAASCSDLGLAMYGVGYRVSGGNGTVLVHDVIPGISVAPRSVTVRATARPGLTPNWGLEAFAICANAAPTMRVEQQTTTSTSTASRNIDRICGTAGTFAHGVGAQSFSAGDVVDGRIALNVMAALNTRSGFAAAGENAPSPIPGSYGCTSSARTEPARGE